MNKHPVPLNILLVDDDQNICRTLDLSLTESGHTVTSVDGVDAAIMKLSKVSFDMILTDFKMGHQTGLDLILKAKKVQPHAMIILMTAFSSIENAVDAIRAGAFDYLPKPFTTLQLDHLVLRIGEFVQLRRENEELKASCSRKNFFAGYTSPETRKTEEFIRIVAPTEGTVLLTGESGTGKSELAKLVHELSQRAPYPFVTVCCTTLTESLVESELFGHVRGAFTGAVKDKVGKLQTANKGTLFLDEIGDLALPSQAKLLRFLQDRVFERVGSNSELSVDTRIIAATNRDLPSLVAKGLFREDLSYRLNTFEYSLSPLRERLEDLNVLVCRILTELRTRMDLNQSWSLPKEIEDVFLQYSWPGNIRELKNVLERLVILSQSRMVTIDDLPRTISRTAGKGLSQTQGLTTLEDLEKQHIKQVLAQEPNLERAADILGITSVTLWRKRKIYGFV